MYNFLAFVLDAAVLSAVALVFVGYALDVIG